MDIRTALKAAKKAAWKNDVATVRDCMAVSPVVAQEGTALIDACAAGSAEVALLLLDVIDDLSTIRTSSGDTVLGRACTQTSGVKFKPGHGVIIRALLDRGEDPHQIGRNGMSALALAAWHGDFQSVDTLLQHGVVPTQAAEHVALADPDAAGAHIEAEGWTTLVHNSGFGGHEDFGRWSAFEVLCTSRWWTVDLELKKRRGKARPAAARVAGSDAPVVESRMVDLLDALLARRPDDGRDWDQWLRFCLEGASNWGSEAIAHRLIDVGANPVHVLSNAFVRGRTGLLDRIPADQLDVDQRHEDDVLAPPMLVNCVRYGWVAAAGWLLDRGADATRTDRAGWSGLHWGAHRGTNPALLQRLVDAGADPFAQDLTGQTPMSLAQLRNKAKVIAWLEGLS